MAVFVCFSQRVILAIVHVELVNVNVNQSVVVLLMLIYLLFLLLLLRKVRCFDRQKIYDLFVYFFVGEQEIEGLTDSQVPRRLGPKRATRIRRLFNLSKTDDVRDYVIRRTYPEHEKDGKKIKQRVKTPKIQRLVTPQRLQRKRRRISEKNQRRVKRREEAANYQKLLTQYQKVIYCYGCVHIFYILYFQEQKDAKVARRHSSTSVSEKKASISKSGSKK